MKKWVFRVREALTGVLDLHVGERLQRVLKGDVVKVEGSDAVVHLLGVGNELLRELLDLLGVQVPSQPVLRADWHRAAKHHLTWGGDRWGHHSRGRGWRRGRYVSLALNGMLGAEQQACNRFVYLDTTFNPAGEKLSCSFFYMKIRTTSMTTQVLKCLPGGLLLNSDSNHCYPVTAWADVTDSRTDSTLLLPHKVVQWWVLQLLETGGATEPLCGRWRRRGIHTAVNLIQYRNL